MGSGSFVEPWKVHSSHQLKLSRYYQGESTYCHPSLAELQHTFGLLWRVSNKSTVGIEPGLSVSPYNYFVTSKT